MLAYADTYTHIHITTYVVTKSARKCKGVPRSFHWAEGPKIEDESQERGWGSWGGKWQQAPSHQLGGS